jgi:hypothetical protein
LKYLGFNGFVELGTDAGLVDSSLPQGAYTRDKKLGSLVLVRMEDKVNAHVSGSVVDNISRAVWIRQENRLLAMQAGLVDQARW